MGKLFARSNIRKIGWQATGAVAAAGIILMAVGGSAAAALNAWTQTTRADFEAGTPVRLDTASSPGDVKLGMAGVNHLYAFRGNNSKSFWKYNTAYDSWATLADAPDRVKWGGALAYDGGYDIYALRGNGSNDFWRYSISGNIWTALAGAPGGIREGGALTYNNGFIYAMRGNGTRDFWRYHIAINCWTALADTHDNIFSGGALTSDGGNFIYAFQCDDTQAFWRYDIAANTWTLMAEVPDLVGNGGALTYDGSRYIYALRGKGSHDFWRYDTVTNVWSAKAGAPGVVEWGGSLAFAGGNRIYALAGAYTQHFWSYNTSADSWEWQAGTPGSVSAGGALVRGAAVYYPSGNLTSAAHDTGFNADFATIVWTSTTPTGTVVKFQVAANNDNATWVFTGPDGAAGTYYTSSGSSIWSGLDGNRYIKYKAFLSTTNTGVTPVLQDVTITYARQVAMPAVTTGEATAVAETAATLHGTVSSDGGEACQYRFQYGPATGNYTAATAWTGSVTTGESFSAAVSGLGKGKKCYFRAQLQNTSGTANGTELSLLTRPDAPVAGSFKATAVSDTQINLTWLKGEGAQRTMVRRSLTGYPADINDGVLAYFDTGTSFADTGLAPGKTCYYSAWSEVTGSQQWSSSSQAASATTSLSPPVAVGGVVFKVNKAAVLAPWLGITIVSLAGCGMVAGRWKKDRR